MDTFSTIGFHFIELQSILPFKMASHFDNDPAEKNSIREDQKDEDLLLNVANRLQAIMDSKIPPEATDLDIIVDTTLLLWRKCKDIFQKFQTGSEENYRWVFKLENFGKWLFILNVVHDSMVCFNIATIDPAVFAHCSLRLGLIYESLAYIVNKKNQGMNEMEEQFFRATKFSNSKY